MEINAERMTRVIEVIRTMPKGNALDFHKDEKMYPPVDHSEALNFFFFAVTHDYGFWWGDERGYVMPLFGTINGKANVKGSDLLWRALKRAFDENPATFRPERLAFILPDQFTKIFSDDHGPIPFRDVGRRFAQTRAYGRWFVEQNKKVIDILNFANVSSTPLNTFLTLTADIPGYDKDQFFLKKNRLLAMVLASRPERFICIRDPWNKKPIVDYHLMRIVLRLGLIEFDENDEREEVATIKRREWAKPGIEHKVRSETFRALVEIGMRSEATPEELDQLFWMARRYCPETRVPECEKCIFAPACARNKDHFQPVTDTTNY